MLPISLLASSVAPPPPALTARARFLAACSCNITDRPPVWLMRQAGRSLPEYRTLKETHSFLDLVRTPELAAQVTLQPVDRFHFDAAILFSDILIIPEAMGQPYSFRETGGIEMQFPIRTAADIARLDPARIPERLAYVSDALKLVAARLGHHTALIGFAGSPWTLANYMIEGASVRDWSRATALLHEDPRLFASLMEKLTQAVIATLKLQIAAGADAIQIFDSSGGLLAPSDFEAGSGRWLNKIVEAIRGEVPVIVFSKGAHSWSPLANTGASVLGIDWTVPIDRVAAILPPGIAVQGNLNPVLLTTRPDIVRAETMRLLRLMRHRPGFIFNLGHGVPPGAKIECIQALVDAVRSSS